jgi:hypothetical protein
MITDGFKNGQVVTSEGKKIGTVKSIDSNFLSAFKKGLIRDERMDFHIPIDAISHYGSKSTKNIEDNSASKAKTAKSSSIKLNLSEKEVKHVFEFVRDNKHNSDLVSVKSGSGYNMGLREIIRYEALMPNSEKNLDPASSIDRLPSKQEYICDMRMQKFYHPNELQDHRKDLHSAATGV